MKPIVILLVFLTVTLCSGERISRKKCEEYNELSQKENRCSEDKLKEYSFLGTLGFGRNNNNINWICSVVLVSPEYVLTDLSCVSDNVIRNHSAYVQLSATNLKNPSELHKIVEIIRHPNNQSSDLQVGVALLKMESPVSITPACLYSGEDVEEYIVAGYLNHEHNSQRGVLLNEVNKKIEDEACTKYIKGTTWDEDVKRGQQFCMEGGPISCYMISGSPGLNKDNELQCMHNVAGLLFLAANPSSKCTEGGYVFYVKVTAYVDWIESVLWK